MDSNYKVQFECASQLIKALIQESNEKNKLISELEAKNRELRYNPYHDPSNGRFTTANSSEMLYGKKIRRYVLVVQPKNVTRPCDFWLLPYRFTRQFF